jgi:hypothetical protein
VVWPAVAFVGGLDDRKQERRNMRRYVSLVLSALFATLVFAPTTMSQMMEDQ